MRQSEGGQRCFVWSCRGLTGVTTSGVRFAREGVSSKHCPLHHPPSSIRLLNYLCSLNSLLFFLALADSWLLLSFFSSHENSYIKICQLFMVFISSVSSVDILGITQIFNDCLILQYFCIWFFLVWWSILLSSNLSAASILRICYKAKISFLEWLCHCRGKVPL